MKHEFEKYCKNYQDIENYEKAKADNFKGWHCHHRLETHTSDGERRPVDIGYEELKALGMYYNRPASELVFLTTREHHAFRKGRHLSEEHKKKIGAASKGNKYHLGYHHSEEARRKMREAKKGKNIWTRGRRWFNNGKICIRAKECPPGFVPGRLRK